MWVAPAAAETRVLSDGEQPVLQQFLIKHDILKAPDAAQGISPAHAMDYHEVSPYPAHNRIWSFEKQGYVLITVGQHRR